MHNSTCELVERLDGCEVVAAIAALVTEGRSPAPGKGRGLADGPHCTLNNTTTTGTATAPHVCHYENALCVRYERVRACVLSLWRKSLPLCVDVLLVPRCCGRQDLVCHPANNLQPSDTAYLLEQWHVNVSRRTRDFSTNFNVNQLINAIRSQLYFSQLSAWLASPDEQVRRGFLDKTIVYSLTVPGETYGCAKFANNAQHHHFPTTDLAAGTVLNVSLSNLPRTHHIPPLTCSKCAPAHAPPITVGDSAPHRAAVLDDRMQMSCTLKGKHRCDDYDEVENCGVGEDERENGCLTPTSKLLNDRGKMSSSIAKHRFKGYGETGNCGSRSNGTEEACKTTKLLNDRSQICNFNGKHRCKDYNEPGSTGTEQPCKSTKMHKHRFKDYDQTEELREEDCSTSPTSKMFNDRVPTCPFNGNHHNDRLQLCTSSGKHRCKDYNETGSCDEVCKTRKLLNERTQTCNLNGKHRCKDNDEIGELEEEACSSSSSTSKPKLFNDRIQICTFNGKYHCKDYTKPTEQQECTSTSTSRSLFANLSNSDLSKMKSLSNFMHADSSKCDITRAKLDSQFDSKLDLELSRKEFVEVLNVLRHSGPIKHPHTKKQSHDLVKQSKGDILLDAILRSSKIQEKDLMMCAEEVSNKRKCAHKLVSEESCCVSHEVRDSDNQCDMSVPCSDSNRNNVGGSSSVGGSIYVDASCDIVKRKKTDCVKLCDISNVFSLEYLEKRQKVKVKQKITFEDESPCAQSAEGGDDGNNTLTDCKGSDVEKQFKEVPGAVCGSIPSALEQAKFRKSLDSAASMVFHSRTGLPLTSSPAPVRRGKSCFDFDSSINSVSAIRSALFSLASCSTDEDSESDCSVVSPCSPDATNGLPHRDPLPVYYRHRAHSNGLLGSFVESVLNGRLEPVSTVHGFTADLGASGSFCPRHVVLPVTVFFYTLGDNDKVSTPYLGHINLGKKGYMVPRSGTLQVTLFNPLGTVVKMFVLLYDLSDMPPNAQTFLRQRTLYMPAHCHDADLQWSHKWLRYLIHLRFMSSKSGRIYLHSDIRMIICRKSDLDTATAHGLDMCYELRSFTNTPTNPRFSPRK